MQIRTRFLTSLLIVAALAAPTALRASAKTNDSRYHGTQQRNQGRFYDADHRDWHDWNDAEERFYMMYLNEIRRPYMEFPNLDERQQAQYWVWRHNHPDPDRDVRGQRNDGSPGRFYDDQARDWHDWNDVEERAYRQYIAEQRREYRDFGQLTPNDQHLYWLWRHNHMDSQRDVQGQRGDRLEAGRYYDDRGRDWHGWNDNEERAYRQYLAETRREYTDFALMIPGEQQQYWFWRHNHPDRDDRGGIDNRNGGQGRRYYDQNTGQWHDWDDNQDRAYRRYLEENRRGYVDFDHADLGLQLQFWLWRQFHNDGGAPVAQRYYDNRQRDYHEWDMREETAYRSYLSTGNRTYIQFSVANPRIQNDYWVWRHSHPDPDEYGNRRYFDQGHSDWHVWDQNEDRAYRSFMQGRNWPYRELWVLNPRDQQRYWDWRHKHPDRDHR